MSSLVLPARTSARPAPAAETARARLQRLPFPPEATIGIPYYDDEFEMAQSKAHAATVRDLGPFLDRLAAWTGLTVLSDNPVWYWIHEHDRQQILYPDYALALATGREPELARDLHLALEIVSTERPEKERKDSERMRARNAANGVPEFGLLYPEPEDARALRWFWLDPHDDTYREATLPPDRRFRSQALPGLELEVLEPAAWRLGRKIRLWYRGARIPCVEEEAQRAEQEAQRAEQEAQRAMQEEQRATLEAQRAAQEEQRATLEAQRAAQEAQRAAQEEQRATLEAQRAMQEAQRADAAEAENARLRALLRQAGLASD